MAINSNSGKDTIYVDIDDEITTVIEKVRASNEKIVALVLPKRASVLQSIVNMKLLKRSADQAKKSVVLITSETGLLPLAGAVGFYVAKNLQTKPEVPPVPGEAADTVDDTEVDESAEEVTAETAGDKPVGELAAAAGTPILADRGSDAIETLEIDDDDDVAPAAETSVAAAKPVKPKKNRKLAIPNFDRFRLGLVLAGFLLIVLIVGLYLANVVLPKGTVIITTDTSDINSNLTLNLDSNAKTLDATKLIIPAQIASSQKNGSQQVPTTGKKNNGDKASGSVTMTAGSCSANVPDDVAAGTGISTSGLTFITQENTSFTAVIVKGKCIFQSTDKTQVKAQAGGSNYNIGPATFSVAGRSDVSASSSTTFSGGTDNIVQVVAQADIDSANQKIASQNGDSVKHDLVTKIQQLGLYPMQATFQAGTPTTTNSANVGDQSSTVTVTQSTTYTMFGVKESDLKTLVDNDVKDQIDPSKQSILSEGLSKATFRVNNVTDKTAQLAMSTVATAGPDLKTETIKQQVAGKKAGEIKSMLGNDPGVTKVDVQLSPFWVTKAPKPSKLTVTFVKSKP